MRNTFINTVIEACRKRDDIFILSGDAGLGVFDDFCKEFPDRFLNMGVAEQNTTSFAAGLALSGYKVFIYNIVPFVLYRCYEQVRNDICYQGLPVVLIGIGSGITYAPMGMSHYSIEDIGLAQTLPNLVTISPMDPIEAQAAALFAIDCDKPVYVRLAKRGEPCYHPEKIVDITSPLIVREGCDTALVYHGSISNAVMEAYECLLARGRAPMVISVPTLQPLDSAALLGLCTRVRHVVCVEEHFSNCGLGGMLLRLKAEHSAPWKLDVLGIPFQYIHEVGSVERLRTLSGISAADIIHAVETGRGVN
jgi:transketolase